MSIDPLFVRSNHIECGFWCAIGIGFLIAALFPFGSPRRICVAAAVTFIIFGASDWVEAITGAWWRPWWLLAWKAACLLVLLWLLILHSRRRA